MYGTSLEHGAPVWCSIIFPNPATTSGGDPAPSDAVQQQRRPARQAIRPDSNPSSPIQRRPMASMAHQSTCNRPIPPPSSPSAAAGDAHRSGHDHEPPGSNPSSPFVADQSRSRPTDAPARSDASRLNPSRCPAASGLPSARASSGQAPSSAPIRLFPSDGEQPTISVFSCTIDSPLPSTIPQQAATARLRRPDHNDADSVLPPRSSARASSTDRRPRASASTCNRTRLADEQQHRRTRHEPASACSISSCDASSYPTISPCDAMSNPSTSSRTSTATH
ncbi:hypothetical protein ACLOJK_001354 [Asimina triloba]